MPVALTLDLHVHTDYSHDGADSVEKIIEGAVAKKLDGIALCDHDTTEGVHAARTYVADHHVELLIIPGIEVTTTKGHLIALGIEEGIETGLSPAETIRIAREKKGAEVIIAPHPFHHFRHSIGNLCIELDVDALEIYNSRYFFGVANEKARIKALRNKITAVAGSDAHSAECVGLATVEVEAEPEEEAILIAIKEGNVRIKSCKRTPLWAYFTQLL